MTQPIYRMTTDKEANAMASNDLEVLDPATPIEQVTESAPASDMDRRHFFAAMGVAGVAAGAALFYSKPAEAQQPSPNGYAQVDVLNFLLNLKYLKGTLYSYLTQGVDLPASSYVTLGSGVLLNAPKQLFTSTSQTADIFNEMYYDELNQLIALRAALGAAVVPRQTMNLLGTGPSGSPSGTASTATYTVPQAIALARLLEDLSASAFAGATRYLTGSNLTLAAQCLASDAQHAGLIRLISIQQGVQYQGTQYASYSTSNTSQTSLTFSGQTTTGSNLIYAFLPTPVTVTTGNPPNLPAVGNVLTGIGIPPGAGAVITAVNFVASATPTAIIIKGTNVLSLVSSTSGLAVGQPITGTNVPANSFISAIGTNTITFAQSGSGTQSAASNSTTVAPTGYVSTGSAIITGVSSTTGLILNQPITGTGIQANTTITSFSSSAGTITLSQNATATSLATSTGVLTNGSAIVNSVSTLSGFVAGASITGSGIQTGTTISSFPSSNQIQLSLPATASSPVQTNTSFTGFITNASATITGVVATTAPAVGQLLVGPGIPLNATVKSISGTSITMSVNATATSTITATGITGYLSNVITSVSSVTGFVVGATITGTFIPTGATITNVGTNTITITSAPTAANPTGGATSNEAAASNIVTPAVATIFSGGQQIQTPATETVTSPATATFTIGLSPITIAGPATITGVNSLSVVVPDNLDVEPGDPGTASVSATGPSLIAGTSGSSALYQGFFNTAGAATSGSTSTPPGFAFARTFQQVLAVLYGYNATNSNIATQNYEGGFFPVGVSGPINSTI
jgi:hypothetical protein